MESVHKQIILDDEDKWLLEKYSWSLDSHGYAQSRSNRKCGLLHKFILPAKDGFIIDHINRNPLDNRRCNLRYATKQQNNFNSSIRKDNTSGYRGVIWNKQVKKWHVQIAHNKKRIYLGCFNSIKEASEVYKSKAVELFGEYLGAIEK